MIERARLAAASLRKGETAQNVVHSLGFYDQAHLINSLREIVGQTPSQLGIPEVPRSLIRQPGGFFQYALAAGT